MRPPFGLEALQLSVTLQSKQRPLQSRPEIVDVVVLSRVLLDGERVLVTVQRRAKTERVQVTRRLVEPVLGRARVDHERVPAVAVLYLVHAVCGRQRQLRLVHPLIHVAVELIAAASEKILREAVLDESVLDVVVLGEFDGRVDSLG